VDFRFLAISGTDQLAIKSSGSDSNRPKAAISLTVDAIGIGRIFG
jgi:hypothetical protein